MQLTKSLAALLALATLSGCAKVGTQNSAGGGRHPWTQAGVLRVGIQSEPKNLNPVLASNTTDNAITRLMFDPLISADAKGNPVPMLAAQVPTLQNGGISKDGLTITYKLRPNVKWQDGQRLTSKDVKFTYEAVMNSNNNVTSRRGYDLVKSVATPNATTVVFTMKQKFAPVINTLFAESDNPVTIIPAHLLSKFHDLNQVPFNNQPMGSGPFKLAQWQHGDHLTFVPNNDYFLGKPRLKKIVVHVIPDENTEINELKTHDLDWMFEASTATYKFLKTMTDINTHLVPHNGYEGIQFNTSRPLLRDPRVRQAIAYAIDRNVLVDNLTYGSAKLATEDLPDFMWAYNPQVKVYPHDVQKAKQLLSEAGWTMGRNGVLTKNGEKLSLLLVSNGQTNATRRQASVLVQSMLKQVGIDVEVKTYPGAVLFAPAGEGGILQLGKFDMGLSGWFAGIDPDDSSNYICSMIPPGGYNYTRYCNKQMDSAQQDALTHFDQPARKVAYAKIESLLADDMPQLFFWWPRQAQPVNPDFQGFDPNPVTETWNSYQWAI
ncbi:MAG: peptide ABC transporter substrate-binding protein [Candidatus Eremiobacteraeota bacterium]|nr:peptide ABC transporter substrate-binding protein [Candidatus Eremiobacteraeota bacterium]